MLSAMAKRTRTGKRLGRPPLPPGERREQWNGKLAPATIARLRELSLRDKISQAAVVDRAVERLP